MYKITLDDNSEIICEDSTKSNWNEIPEDRKIKAIHYNLLGVNCYLEGFESYNHVIYKESIIIRNTKSPACVDRIYKIVIGGKWENRIYKAVYDYKAKQYYTQIEVIDSGSLLYPSLSSKDSLLKQTGWKKGKFDIKEFPKLRNN